MTEEQVEKEKNYNGYPLFNLVSNKNLQAWNRAAVMHNMCNDGSPELVKGYVSQLSHRERLACLVVVKSIATIGLDETRNNLLGKATIQ